MNDSRTRYGIAAAAVLALASGVALAGHGRHHGDHAKRFAAMDTDGNGAVSQVEADAFFTAKAAAIDADRNGAVTVEELRAYHEAQRRQRQAEHLAELDADKDGRVSTAEFAKAGSTRLMSHDADGNSEVAKGEGHGRRHQR
jgi:hypothetical protein